MAQAQTAARQRGHAVADLAIDDVLSALIRGIDDFRRAPQYGLFFGAVYVLVGLIIVGLIVATGQTFWAVPITVGFPLIAPFAAVGLYETSRRLEAGEPLTWPGILGVVWAERDRQLPWFGALMVVWFLAYLFVSHVLFALMMGLSVMTNITSSLEVFLTPRGLTMLAVQIVVGGAFAFSVFAACATSLPMMMDREVDFITAMTTSIRVVTQNPGAMLAWAVLVVAMLAVAMLPAFLGLFVALPVLGHTTWHIYRRALPRPL